LLPHDFHRDFEGIDSQRGICWRSAESPALRTFLGYSVTETTPVQVSMTINRKRLCLKVFTGGLQRGFPVGSGGSTRKDLLRGKAIGIDATTFEANAAMRSIVRKDPGDHWKEYLRKLAAAEGIENPTDEDRRGMDRKREGKKFSNNDWSSPIDPESRIAKMKDGRTRLAYEAKHSVDLETEVIVAAEIHPADEGHMGNDNYSSPQCQLEITSGPALVWVDVVGSCRPLRRNGVLGAVGDKDAVEPKGAGRRFQPPLFSFSRFARRLSPLNSRMIEWCTRRSTAAMVVIGSLKIWSHFENTRLLLTHTLRRS
jgi:hypothetical protein